MNLGCSVSDDRAARLLLCKDCFYCDKTDLPSMAGYWLCTKITRPSPLTGMPRSILCGIERISIAGECGPEGKLFVDRKEREREINSDTFPKEVDNNGDWKL